MLAGYLSDGAERIYRSVGGGWPSPFLSEPIVALPETDEATGEPDAEEVPVELPVLDLPDP